MKNTIRTVLFAVALVMITQVPVSAIPVSSGIQTEQNQLEGVKNKREELELSIEKLDNQIENFMMEVSKNKDDIESNENEINNSMLKISDIETETVEKQKLLDKKLRLTYMYGNTDYFKILFESKTFIDLVTRIDAINKIASMDKKIISELKENEENIKSEKAVLEEKHERIVNLKAENENKLASLNSEKEKQKKLIEEAKSQERLLASRDEENETQKLVKNTIKEIKKVTPKPEVTRGASSASGESVISYASNFLGIPYLWGGTSPSTGFDCSGFTQYVYSHFGIKLGRTTYNQINDGQAVSRNELQAGDLVFFGKGGDPTHMGIYIGNNTYIHSPRTGDVLKISPMTRPDYITARRVL
jgi:cell wall-associated NlpC family hydrolase